MHLLSHLWREWVSDNPFLLLDLRRLRGRKRLSAVLAGCLGVPVLIVAAWPAVAAVVPPEWEAAGAGAAALVFYALSLAHFGAALCLARLRLDFEAEATGERLQFLRLLPLTARELLGRLAAARGAVVTGYTLALLPLYAVVALAGELDPRLFLGLPLLYALVSFGHPLCFPTVAAPVYGEEPEDPLAMDGTDALPDDDSEEPEARAGGGGCLWWIGSLLVGVFVLQALGDALIALLEGAALAFAPPGPFAALSLLVCAPQPFFGWQVALFWTLVPYWALRRASQLEQGAAAWESERPADEEREPRRQRLGAAAAALLLLFLAGHLWEPLFASGALGELVHSPTTSGGVAALLLLCGLYSVSARLMAGGDPLPWRQAAGRQAEALGIAVAVPLAVGLLGGALWPEPLAALGLLGAAAAVGLLFQRGWQAVMRPIWEAGPMHAVVALLRLLLETAPVALPLVALRWSGAEPPLHLLAALSPVYAGLALLPGIWTTEPAVPFWLALALPAGTGCALLAAGALASRARATTRPPEPERELQPALEPPEPEPEPVTCPAFLAEPEPTPDPIAGPATPGTWIHPVDARLREQTRAWDNPLFTLAVRRWYRGGSSLATAIATRVALYFGAVGLLVLYAVLSALRLAAEPAGSATHGSSSAAADGLLLFALFTLVGALLHGGLVISGLPGGGNPKKRDPNLVEWLFLSPLGDRPVATGLVAALLLPAVPSLAAGAAASLAWCVLAVAAGASPLWLLVWCWAVAVYALVAPYPLCWGIHEWRDSRDLLRDTAHLLAALLWLAWFCVTFGALAAHAGNLWLLPGWVVLLQLAGLLVMIAALPRELNVAAGIIRAARRRDFPADAPPGKT